MRPSAQLATARALRWREDFQAFYHQDPSYGPSICGAGAPARNAPACNRSKTSSPWSKSTGRHHRLAHHHLSNGLLEGINSLIQAAKARARGYHNKTKMIIVVYLTAAELKLPTLTHPTPAYMPSR
jgi:hypothetical protein